MKDLLGVGHVVRATGHSLDGIREAFRNGCAFRQELALGLVQFVVLPFFQESLWVKVGLVALWVLLLSAELLNTGVEAVVDLASPGWNELAKRAKDCCSAAVSLIVTLLAFVWLIVIVRQLKLLCP